MVRPIACESVCIIGNYGVFARGSAQIFKEVSFNIHIYVLDLICCLRFLGINPWSTRALIPSCLYLCLLALICLCLFCAFIFAMEFYIAHASISLHGSKARGFEDSK